MRRLVYVMSVLLIGVVATRATAQSLRPGDIVASGGTQLLIGFTFPVLLAYAPTTVLRIGPINNLGGGDALWSPDGRLYALGLDGYSLDVLTPQLGLERRIALPGTSRASALTMNAQGEVIVVFRNGDLRWLSLSGTTIRTGLIPLAADAEIVTADLGTDQCVLYFFSPSSAIPGRIGRYDLCRAERLGDLPQSVSYAFTQSTIRVLPDGSVLFAGLEAIFRFRDGTVATFPVPDGDRATTLAPQDADTIWIGGSSLRKMHLGTGAVLAGPVAFNGDVHALTIYGVPRAAAVAVVNTPTLSDAAMIALVILIVVLAVMRVR